MEAGVRAHWQYLKYIVRHKWFVFRAGRLLGLPLWLLIVHDWSKFRPSEWFPYVGSFHIDRKTWRDRFDMAWNDHQKRNKHHWQYWVLINDEDGTYPLPMPDRYRREMLADWMGAGKAQGKPDTLAWYTENREKMNLDPETREWIEVTLREYIQRVWR